MKVGSGVGEVELAQVLRKSKVQREGGAREYCGCGESRVRQRRRT